jgi:hypothetical protein
MLSACDERSHERALEWLRPRVPWGLSGIDGASAPRGLWRLRDGRLIVTADTLVRVNAAHPRLAGYRPSRGSTPLHPANLHGQYARTGGWPEVLGSWRLLQHRDDLRGKIRH